MNHFYKIIAIIATLVLAGAFAVAIDKNALKVISIRKDTKYLLGYIIKDKIPYVNSLLDKLKFITLIKKNNNKNIYYYLVFKII